MPASVTIMPENECPASTVGPSCRARTCCAEATASGSVVKGFCTEVTLRPTACKRGITSDQDDPSANSPCTRTTLRAFFAGCAAAAVPWNRMLAAPAAAMVTNVRRSSAYLCRKSSWVFMELLLCVKLELAAGESLSWLLEKFYCWLSGCPAPETFRNARPASLPLSCRAQHFPYLSPCRHTPCFPPPMS